MVPSCKTTRHTRIAKTPTLILFGIMAATVITYIPGLNGPFVFDDIPNITQNHALHLSSLQFKNIQDAVTAVHSGPLGRPISYLSFALNFYFFGLEPITFKIINLVLHLINGFFLFLLTRLLLRGSRILSRTKISRGRIDWIALVVSTIWLLHPLALTSVLYTVQRMTSLSTLFTLLAVILYLHGRLRQIVGHRGLPKIVLAIFICMPMATFSKENGLLIPFYLLLIEWCFLRFYKATTNIKYVVWFLLTILALCLLGAGIVKEDLLSWLVRTYSYRPFDVYERCMTEMRVIWFYIKLIFLPRLSDLGLFHDDIDLSTGLYTPISTIFALTGIIGITIASMWWHDKHPIFSFGVLFFLIGHSMESTFLALEIAHEHRNYLPMYGPILILGYYALQPNIVSKYTSVITIGISVYILTLATITWQRSIQWGDSWTFSLALAQFHPHSARSNYEAGRLIAQIAEHNQGKARANELFGIARNYFISAYRSDNSNHNGLFAILYIDSLIGNRENKEVLEMLNFRLRTQPLQPATGLAFTSLHQCWSAENCEISTTTLANLYYSGIQNSRASKKTRSSLLNEIAIVEFKRGNIESATNLFAEAIELTPNRAQIWYNFIHVLAKAGQLDESQTLLVKARQKFGSSKDIKRLSTLENMLHDLKLSRGMNARLKALVR